MDKEQLERAARLWRAHCSNLTIAKQLGIEEAVVMRYLNQIKKLAEQS